MKILVVYFARFLRAYGLPGRLERCSDIILRHAQIPAQGQLFGISHTANPKP